ncbi:50S ribosomal protein L35 [candidate division WOR-3 bacterium]|nr:50S ribosomal protein L35 [candidate division WOR-3 bacterium]MCK4526881.1 50S ribosomal protein L35 [candidate division WOR-3 bacterium]
MPKLKTKGAIKKRFRTTKTGKIKFKRANSNHLRSKHSNKNKNRLNKDKILPSAESKRLKNLIH